jgi:hypothetical protein
MGEIFRQHRAGSKRAGFYAAAVEYLTTSTIALSLAAVLLRSAAPSGSGRMMLGAPLRHLPTAETKTAENTKPQFGDQYGGTMVHVQRGTGYC